MIIFMQILNFINSLCSDSIKFLTDLHKNNQSLINVRSNVFYGIIEHAALNYLGIAPGY
jgi:hypothetical protein